MSNARVTRKVPRTVDPVSPLQFTRMNIILALIWIDKLYRIRLPWFTSEPINLHLNNQQCTYSGALSIFRTPRSFLPSHLALESHMIWDRRTTGLSYIRTRVDTRYPTALHAKLWFALHQVLGVGSSEGWCGTSCFNTVFFRILQSCLFSNV